MRHGERRFASLNVCLTLPLRYFFIVGLTGRYSLRSRLTRLPDKSYKRECQETYRGVDSVPKLFCLGIQPNRLNVHARSTSGLPQEAVASFRSMNR